MATTTMSNGAFIRLASDAEQAAIDAGESIELVEVQRVPLLRARSGKIHLLNEYSLVELSADGLHDHPQARPETRRQ